MKMSLLTFALLLVQLSIVFGAMYRSPIKTKQQYGETVKYCQHGKLQILPGSLIRDLKSCMKCECSIDGLSCATLPGAFAVRVPDDSTCISVLSGCKNVWVYRKKNKKLCPKHLRPTSFSMVGK